MRPEEESPTIVELQAVGLGPYEARQLSSTTHVSSMQCKNMLFRSWFCMYNPAICFVTFHCSFTNFCITCSF